MASSATAASPWTTHCWNGASGQPRTSQAVSARDKMRHSIPRTADRTPQCSTHSQSAPQQSVPNILTAHHPVKSCSTPQAFFKPEVIQ